MEANGSLTICREAGVGTGRRHGLAKICGCSSVLAERGHATAEATGSSPVFRSTSGVPMQHRSSASRRRGWAGCARGSHPHVQRTRLCVARRLRTSRMDTAEVDKLQSPGDGTGRHACLRSRILGVRLSPGAPQNEERWLSGSKQRRLAPGSHCATAGSNPARSTRFIHGLAQWAERVLWEHEAGGSRPPTVTTCIHIRRVRLDGPGQRVFNSPTGVRIPYTTPFFPCSVNSVVRVPVCLTGGRGFESRTGRHLILST